jgi:heterodisulfide reductase subunit C
MPSFGFSVQPPQHIDLDKNYRAIFDFIKENEPSFLRCIYCGSCGATCSAGNFSQMSLRKVNLLISRGQISEVKNLIDNCLLCGKCQLVCPRNVNTRKVILLIHKALKMPLS